jgi:hypothetical protein
MYYDEKKGRYVILGEEESDDDEPPPPPPGARKIPAEEAKQAESQEKKEDAGQVSGLNALTSAGFGGALANRGRGRGRGRGKGPAVSRFPQTFNQDQMQASDKPATLPDEEPKLEQRPDPKLF